MQTDYCKIGGSILNLIIRIIIRNEAAERRLVTGRYKEKISAVNFLVASTDSKGKIMIIANDPDSDNPLDGKVVASFDYNTTYSGNYTFDVPNAPVLSAGTDFSIVIMPDVDTLLFTDGYDYLEPTCTSDRRFDRTYITSDSKLLDCAKDGGCTIRIKAYTNDAGKPVSKKDKVSVSYVMDSAAQAGPVTQYKNKSDVTTITPFVAAGEDCNFLGWATSPDQPEPEWLPLDVFDSDENLTLYPVWEKVTPNINPANGTYMAQVNFIEKSVFSGETFDFFITYSDTHAVGNWQFKGEELIAGSKWNIGGVVIEKLNSKFSVSIPTMPKPELTHCFCLIPNTAKR